MNNLDDIVKAADAILPKYKHTCGYEGTDEAHWPWSCEQWLKMQPGIKAALTELTERLDGWEQQARERSRENQTKAR